MVIPAVLLREHVVASGGQAIWGRKFVFRIVICTAGAKAASKYSE